MDRKLERILQKVQKPARYVGGEYGQTIKDIAQVRTRVALCFPDIYEIGMSNIGLRILYHTANQMPGVWCERVFMPWEDMEEAMRREGIPLYALESGDPVHMFDVIAFSLGYEMAYTTVLAMLDLAGVPIRASERKSLTPLVIAGGTCAYNPEPLADFIDLFIVGEGEEVNGELIEALTKARDEGLSKEEFLRRAAQIPGVYVPSLYAVSYKEDGAIEAVTPREGAPLPVVKRIVQDFDAAPFPTETIIPTMEIVHDRTALELFRGCVRGCRFCQAGFVYRPIRSRSKETLVRQAQKALEYSGYEELTLASLSTSDYRELTPLCDDLLEYCTPRKISLSLPSLRADNFSVELMEKIQAVRKTGLTFAPEAGSQRLRDVINKNVTEEDLLETCKIAFEGGWSAVKLYFMLGLPTETDEDVLAIADLAEKVLRIWKQHASNKKRGVRITVSTSCFVPKPFTPFQWAAQVPMEEYRRRVELLRSAIRSRAITYNWHDPETSFIEAVLSRGDRRLCAVLEHVQKNGGRLEAWEGYFDIKRWEAAFRDCGVDPAFYALRERGEEEVFPWEVTSVGVPRSFFRREWEKAFKGAVTPDCRENCSGCGAVALLKGGRRCDE